jgi:ankyrin repeat protein
MPVDNDLHKAANKGDLEECQRLVENPNEGDDPIDVNEPGASDRRPLHRSSGAGHLDCTKYFMEKGAELDAVDKSGRTALHWAAIAGYGEIVSLLLDAGSNVLLETTSKCNVLHLVCEANKPDMVRLILTHPKVAENEETKTALTMAKSNEDKTAWQIAEGKKDRPLCQALKDCGDVNGASSSCVIC